ncbi:hypothetical protein HanXRQr2_Chr14g0622891 [Helianthus annuus]|uniref:Uncharacterized protein n=1 Tax=Helianthus annuus TaxID=4232 RepID=A0A9K3E5C5_HELAN|nr:hypothetical protein HanXRQr2_Chr14g0622891 [Helianthus annuus]
MRVRLQAQCLQKCSINSLSVMLSKLSISRMCKMAELTHTNTAWVYIYPAHDARSKDPIDGPKDHLSRISCSKHQH